LILQQMVCIPYPNVHVYAGRTEISGSISDGIVSRGLKPK
jgi:hypothetical protein